MRRTLGSVMLLVGVVSGASRRCRLGHPVVADHCSEVERGCVQ